MSKTFIADKETLDKIYNIVAADPVYGFIEHNAILAPSQRIEYVGANADYTPISVTMGGGYSLNSWADFPWLKGNKPYMVKSDGTPDYRLDETDYTKREDGTDSDVANTDYDGGAFAWAPRIYKQEYMAGDDRVVLFRMTAADGFEPVGFVDGDGNVLEGVWIPMFYGSIVDEKMRSLSGIQPDYSKTTAQQKTAIDAFGDRARFFGGSIMNTLIDLEILFCKTTNLQAAYGSGNCNGYDSSLTPTMGVKQNAVIGGGQFYGTSDGKSLNKIFHSIVLGSYQQYMRDPYLLLVNGRYKVSPNYEYDVTGATYIDTGISLPKVLNTDGSQKQGWFYPHKYQTIPGFGHVPVYPYKGSSSTGGCDGLYQDVGITAVALRFGYCNYGTVAGGRCLNLHGPAGDAYWDIGSALLLLPPVGMAV
jgi:hypothetical protein